MALGTPVVSSNRGSLPEVLGDAALLVDPGDDGALAHALEEVLTRPELRDRLSVDGLARARTFTWGKCADRTLDVYRSVLSAHRTAVA
jgi:glycosyltransferase involved in cell wall biosynthesis